MESCDGPVKIIVGGREWYYQKFYKSDGEIDVVRLYDSGGEFVREFKSVNRLTGSLGMMVRRQREAEINAALGIEEKKYTPRKIERGILKEEKMGVRQTLVKRLNELKGDKCLAEFADDVGLSYQVIGDYLRGITTPSVFAVKRIADRCGVTIDWLLREDGKMQ